MLDNLSKRLMQELQEDGRHSYRDLARKLGVSEGTIRSRVRDLQNKHVIKIEAVPDPRKLGCGFICIMGLEVQLPKLKSVGAKLAQIPNVYYLTHVTGHFDLMAILLFHTSEDLSNFVRNTIANIPGIVKTETFVNVDIIKTPWVEKLGIAELLKF